MVVEARLPEPDQRPRVLCVDDERNVLDALAIARSVVVDKHGGVIDVESTIGVGTTFSIRLPLEEASKR
jgi:light-regulated signal transduction histidine kinase (bacteriophytochrome)